MLLLDLSREVSQQLLDELLLQLVNQAYFVMSALLGYSLLSSMLRLGAQMAWDDFGG